MHIYGMRVAAVLMLLSIESSTTVSVAQHITLVSGVGSCVALEECQTTKYFHPPEQQEAQRTQSE